MEIYAKVDEMERERERSEENPEKLSLEFAELEETFQNICY